MAFRDDGEAARARADALAAQLAERDAEVEALRAALAQRDEALRTNEARLRDEKSEASPCPDASARAQAALDELEERGAKRKKDKEEEEKRKRTAETARERVERKRRRRSSVSVLGDVPLGAALPLLPFVGIGAFYVGIAMSGLWALGLSAGVLIALLLCIHLGREWARFRWHLEEEWARSRPYALEGYPALLETKPRTTPDSALPTDDEHEVLEVSLSFRDGPTPSDLAAVMEGFDDALSTHDPRRDSPWYPARSGELPKPKPNTFYRPSPVTVERVSSVVDHNRAVRRWVRRFEREVLTPLHQRHGLTRVRLTLR